MQNVLTEHEEGMRVSTIRAGQPAGHTDLGVSKDELDDAFAQLFASDAKSVQVELPGRLLEVVTLDSGVRVSTHFPKRPQRTTCLVQWRDFARYLIA